MRINVSNEVLPGVQTERTLNLGPNEIHRKDVFLDGEYVGQVVYVARRSRSGGTLFGWRAARSASNSRLVTQIEAIRRLPLIAARFPAEATS